MNTSGINPIEYNVLVKLDQVDEKTAGGVFLPDQQKERENFAQIKGTLVAVSPMAFRFEDWPQDCAHPEPGNRVMIAKHAGAQTEGSDGNTYRVVKDKDVLAVINE